MESNIKPYGHITVRRIRDGFIETLMDKRQTIGSAIKTNLAAVLYSRSVEYGVDAIAYGSFSSPGGTFVAGSWAGTTSGGTIGNLIMSNPAAGQAKFVGTFQFGATAQINYFGIGRGYTAPASGVSAIFTGLYAYDNSLNTGSTYLTYNSGDLLVVDWTITLS
jgi:hypothetical protein